MKKYVLILALLMLSGCETFSGLQQDLNNMGQSLNATAQSLTTKKQQTADLDHSLCPPVIVDPRLNSLTEFYDDKKTAPENIVSAVRLMRASAQCEPGEEYLTLQIDLAFDGTLGPKARRKEKDQTFFSYPYFVSVTDNEGNEFVKELFAASMTYTATQEAQSLVETIRQKLPYNDDGTLPPYQIKVGFQLTESQLFYNASL